MNYILLDDPERHHDTFRRRFTMPYGAFCHAHAQWLASLPRQYRMGYTPAYFERLSYSDRLVSEFQVVSFADALAQLEQLGSVLFLTNRPGGVMQDYAVLGTEHLWTARAEGRDLASAIRDDWFSQYALWAQDLYDPNPLFGSEVFAFTEDLAHCLVFTHETDETELPETRVCLAFTEND